ncbi:cupin domain-containing protein [Herbiconiux sp. YIM B11900]|uniref:cupin domain-containing protein n=1 Tax=Herbiconiux sp. YIM B11900 TaxID=3404131 RepID=UPI003F82E2FF
MPHNDKLFSRVVSFDDIPEEEARRGITRKAYASDEVMIVWNTVEQGLEVRPHSHDDFDQLVFILEGEADYHVAGVAHRMRSRDLMLVPRGAEHFIEVTNGPCINIDIFVPPREDYAHLTRWVEQLAAGQPLTIGTGA